MERKVGEGYQWKAIGHCSKGDSCSFSHDGVSGNRCGHRQKKDNRLLMHQKRRHKLTETIKRFRHQRRRFFRNRRPKCVLKFPSGESVQIRRVIIGIFVCVQVM